MPSDDQKHGAAAPGAEPSPATGESRGDTGTYIEPSYTPDPGAVPYTPTVEDTYGTYDDPYAYNPQPTVAPDPPATKMDTPPPPPTGGGASPPEDDEDEGMLRMSFLEHLEELRRRFIYALSGMEIG